MRSGRRRAPSKLTIIELTVPRLEVKIRCSPRSRFRLAARQCTDTGFSLPIHQWLRHQGHPLLMTLLSPDRVEPLKVLDVSAKDRAVQAHMSEAHALGWELWGLMVLVAWYE